MDTALLLRQYYDECKELTDVEIQDLLMGSKIVERLTKDYDENAFFNIFRLICLSEIPYIERLNYTNKIINFVSNKLSTPWGFSYTGSVHYIVPCYNAMLMEAYVRLGLAESQEVKNALNWIKKYQIFERNQKTAWAYDGICKHGGCMHATPCYIGIGKTVRALITYAKMTQYKDEEVECFIDLGIEYMLKHSMFQRLSNGKPISPHITDIMFPQAYMLSLTDLVYIVNQRNLWQDKRCNALRELLKQKEVEPCQWKIDYIYSHKGYKSFEARRNSSQWIAYLFSQK